ncbi:MAG: hemin uptake protein HemP [Halothiobacillaceae bacterium]
MTTGDRQEGLLTPEGPQPVARSERRATPNEIDVAQLMGGQRAVVLVHRSERYLLRVTRHGRLILTK